jgi:hypothetical protein
MKKWSDKNVIKKSPDSAIAIFFAMEDFSNVELLILKFLLTVTNLIVRTMYLGKGSYLDSL